MTAWTDTTTLPIGDIADFVRGVTYKKPQASKEPGDGLVPLLRATNIDKGDLILDDNLVYVPDDLVKEEQRLRSGDVVIATSSGSIRVVGKSGQLKTDWHGTFGAFCGVLRSGDNVLPAYLGHFVQSASVRESWSSSAAGTNINNLKRTDIESTSIPVPPIDDQRRIVEAIETHLFHLDAGVESLERAKRNVERMADSLMFAGASGQLVPHESAGEQADAHPVNLASNRHAQDGSSVTEEPWEVPPGWTWSTFGELSPRVTVGHVGPMKHAYVAEGIPFLRSQNVRPNRFDPDGLKFIDSTFDEGLKKSRLKPGDLVVVRSGSVGVTCVIPDSLPESNCADLVIIQKPAGILSEFASYYMNSVARRLVRQGQTGTALIHFNTKSVAALPVPVPPKAEQVRIIEEIDRQMTIIDSLAAEIGRNLVRSRSLRNSVLAAAFTGELVGQAAA